MSEAVLTHLAETLLAPIFKLIESPTQTATPCQVEELIRAFLTQRGYHATLAAFERDLKSPETSSHAQQTQQDDLALLIGHSYSYKQYQTAVIDLFETANDLLTKARTSAVSAHDVATQTPLPQPLDPLEEHGMTPPRRIQDLPPVKTKTKKQKKRKQEVGTLYAVPMTHLNEVPAGPRKMRIDPAEILPNAPRALLQRLNESSQTADTSDIPLSTPPLAASTFNVREANLRAQLLQKQKAQSLLPGTPPRQLSPPAQTSPQTKAISAFEQSSPIPATATSSHPLPARPNATPATIALPEPRHHPLPNRPSTSFPLVPNLPAAPTDAVNAGATSKALEFDMGNTLTGDMNFDSVQFQDDENDETVTTELTDAPPTPCNPDASAFLGSLVGMFQSEYPHQSTPTMSSTRFTRRRSSSAVSNVSDTESVHFVLDTDNTNTPSFLAGMKNGKRQRIDISALDRPLDVGISSSVTICRFAVNCRNPGCTFGHWSPAARHTPTGQTQPLPTQCILALDCQDPDCLFTHPSPSAAEVCRHEPHCHSTDCRFRHPHKEIKGASPNLLALDDRNSAAWYSAEAETTQQQYNHLSPFKPVVNDPGALLQMSVNDLDRNFQHYSNLLSKLDTNDSDRPHVMKMTMLIRKETARRKREDSEGQQQD